MGLVCDRQDCCPCVIACWWGRGIGTKTRCTPGRVVAAGGLCRGAGLTQGINSPCYGLAHPSQSPAELEEDTGNHEAPLNSPFECDQGGNEHWKGDPGFGAVAVPAQHCSGRHSWAGGAQEAASGCPRVCGV